jgi:hypothetical protein
MNFRAEGAAMRKDAFGLPHEHHEHYEEQWVVPWAGRRAARPSGGVVMILKGLYGFGPGGLFR